MLEYQITYLRFLIACHSTSYFGRLSIRRPSLPYLEVFMTIIVRLRNVAKCTSIKLIKIRSNIPCILYLVLKKGQSKQRYHWCTLNTFGLLVLTDGFLPTFISSFFLFSLSFDLICQWQNVTCNILQIFFLLLARFPPDCSFFAFSPFFPFSSRTIRLKDKTLLLRLKHCPHNGERF